MIVDGYRDQFGANDTSKYPSASGTWPMQDLRDASRFYKLAFDALAHRRQPHRPYVKTTMLTNFEVHECIPKIVTMYIAPTRNCNNQSNNRVGTPCGPVTFWRYIAETTADATHRRFELKTLANRNSSSYLFNPLAKGIVYSLQYCQYKSWIRACKQDVVLLVDPSSTGNLWEAVLRRTHQRQPMASPCNLLE